MHNANQTNETTGRRFYGPRTLTLHYPVAFNLALPMHTARLKEVFPEMAGSPMPTLTALVTLVPDRYGTASLMRFFIDGFGAFSSWEIGMWPEERMKALCHAVDTGAALFVDGVKRPDKLTVVADEDTRALLTNRVAYDVSPKTAHTMTFYGPLVNVDFLVDPEQVKVFIHRGEWQAPTTLPWDDKEGQP